MDPRAVSGFAVYRQILARQQMNKARDFKPSPGLPSSISALYENPLPCTRTGALYNAFSYPTKISPEVIALFIATHTEPGATILDTFAGSGSAGLAVKLCDKPTAVMKAIAARMGLAPIWGPRHAVLYELGVLGSFVSGTMCSPPSPDDFEAAAKKLLAEAEREMGWLWIAEDSSGNSGRLRHAIWSDVLVCPHCLAETSFWVAAVRFSPLRLDDAYECSSCGNVVATGKARRATETYTDPLLGREIVRKKRVLARVHGKTGSVAWQRPPIGPDEERANKAFATLAPGIGPVSELIWGDLYRAGYHTGISHLHHFYTPRNFLAVSCLWRLIDEQPSHLRDALRLLVLSYNGSHSTLMTRVVVKDGQNDFVLTGAQSGVLYVSGLPVEKNVFEGVRRKISGFKDAFTMLAGSKSTVEVFNASSTRLHLPEESVDYVFTDPPFGDYIPYAEINQINEVWLGKATDRSQELIVSDAQGKDVDDYAKMMGEVFCEISRVLKSEGKATVVFHSAKAVIWRALAQAYGEAGLRVRATSVLDKLQASFKQVVSAVSVKGDPLLLLVKDQGVLSGSDRMTDEVFDEVLARAIHSDNSAEKELPRLYSRYVARCLELGTRVALNADEFYSRAGVARAAT